jgi:DNA helicase-2/ATP-dependent DNA helicase PcrA
VARDYQLHPTEPRSDTRIDYAAELNPQQLAAVTAPPGPTLVLAGAGAGKTRTLTYRVAWLLEQGIPQERILLLTFTNKAAREMMQRVGDLIGGDVSSLWGGTFHSIGLRILRRHADRLGYHQDFTVADREDAKDLLSACVAESSDIPPGKLFPKADVLGDIFSKAINTGRSIEEIVAAEHDSFLEMAGLISLIQRRYAERKRAAGLMDFDDLLVLWLKLLRENESIREVYQRRFQFVMVDEYQDTNKLQCELLDELSARHGNLTAVGDDAQSIYSWRGANFANIIDFPNRYPKAQVFKIETNYRSTPEILALANAAIAGNTRQFAKTLQPVRSSGPKPVLVVCGEASEQAAFVAQRALELRDEGQALADMCVLYRSHFHALEIQLELTRRNIPFVITSGLRFFEQAHVKDVAAYLKLIHNPFDELAFKRLVKMLPGIGAKGADKLWAFFHAELTSVVGSAPVPSASPVEVADVDGGPPPPPSLEIAVAPLLIAIASKVPRKATTVWAQLSATLAQAEGPELRNSPSRLIRHVVEADYEAYAEATFENSRSRLEDLDQLANYARQFESTTEFLAQLALQTNMEVEDDDSREDQDRLRLSTIHQAKGLEFSTVFLIMLCEGLFPSAWSVDTLEGLEEERRLYYVALTRAKNELYLSYPLLRFTHAGGNAMQQASRFLAESPAELVEEWNLRPTFSAYATQKRNREYDSTVQPDADESSPEDLPF